ncbi:MAG: phosphotransferase [Reyranella sp.]|nr:phosphotransferase [Reyranella sp.]MBL6651161.1 phosphotransferase [Reyranella sp.]
MRGSLGGKIGEKIGEGAAADIHAWAPGEVVKLFKAHVSRRLSWHEARMTDAVFRAGGPAPEVLGTVTVEGRFGIVLPRLDGPTLLHLSRTGAMTPRETGAIVASLCLAVHQTPPPPDVVSLHELMDSLLRSSSRTLAAPIDAGVRALIERLQPGDGLCHVDPHPGNVIMTAAGPRLVDWTWAVRAPAALDLGCCHVMLSEFAPAQVADPERPRAVNAAVQAEYARLSGRSPEALTAAQEAWLPIACAFYLLLRVFPARDRWLIERVEEAVRDLAFT